MKYKGHRYLVLTPTTDVQTLYAIACTMLDPFPTPPVVTVQDLDATIQRVTGGLGATPDFSLWASKAAAARYCDAAAAAGVTLDVCPDIWIEVKRTESASLLILKEQRGQKMDDDERPPLRKAKRYVAEIKQRKSRA